VRETELRPRGRPDSEDRVCTWQDPDRFDIRRKTTGHLGFGYGIHGCAGQGLARLEGRAILAALARRAKSIEVGEPVREYNNVIRGLKSLPTVLTPA
jgi:cytochrome P450